MFKCYLIGLLFLIGYVVENTSPKFKVGDCVIWESDLRHSNEFLSNDFKIRKILKVGKRNYLYEFEGFFNSLIKNELEIDHIDRTMVKIDCPERLK